MIVKRSILRLCYFSAANLAKECDVRRLVESSRLRNARSGITGILLYDEGAFSQVLEGEPAAVLALFAKIQSDPRHSYVMELHRTETFERLFAPWPMAFLGRGEFEMSGRWPYRDMLEALKRAYSETRDIDSRELLASFFLRATPRASGQVKGFA